MQELDFKKQNYTILGLNNRIEGELTLTGDTIIHGDVKGTITMVGEHEIVIERTGSFEGTLYGHHVEVFGTLKGSLKSNGTLTIRSSAVVSGGLETAKLCVYPGAILNIEGHTTSEPEKAVEA